MNNEKLIVYCRYCGSIAGNEGKCPVTNGSHSMTKSNEPVVCRYCGKTQGNATKCPITNGSHSFQKESDF